MTPNLIKYSKVERGGRKRSNTEERLHLMFQFYRYFANNHNFINLKDFNTHGFDATKRAEVAQQSYS